MDKNIIVTFFFSIVFMSGCASNQPKLINNETKMYTMDLNYQTKIKILNHCKIMADFGHAYQLDRTLADKKASMEFAKSYVIKEHKLKPSEKLDTVLIGYSAFIEMAPGFRPNTMKYYTLAQCLTLHGLKKRLPLDRGPKEQKIKDTLKNCENTSKDDDHLGACILNNLRPMAESF
jgi:hypothetical protein